MSRYRWSVQAHREVMTEGFAEQILNESSNKEQSKEVLVRTKYLGRVGGI